MNINVRQYAQSAIQQSKIGNNGIGKTGSVSGTQGNATSAHDILNEHLASIADHKGTEKELIQEIKNPGSKFSQAAHNDSAIFAHASIATRQTLALVATYIAYHPDEAFG